MRYLFYIFFLLIIICSCNKEDSNEEKNFTEPYILVLGTAQDAGYPQIACEKECCRKVFNDKSKKRLVSSIAIVDPISNESWIFDATPDFTEQTQILSRHLRDKELPDGIFLTHGHIGHYTGLMYLGRESMGTTNLPIYTMPRMKAYLSDNGPWSQLVKLNNIALTAIKNDSTVVLNERISVTPVEVPHRDEFTETVGFVINNQNKKALFIPDIDKWSKWDKNITEYIKEVDVALLDATFFKDGEINRDMSEVPHPFVEESMKLFKNLSDEDKSKVHFIHFNHTNPLLIESSKAEKQVIDHGFNVARQEKVISF